MFSNHGLGTLIYANEYEHIRPAKKKDVRAIQLLTKQAVEADELVKRTQGDDREEPRRLLHLRNRQESGRVRRPARVPRDRTRASWRRLYVSSSHENQGIGRKLIQFVENRARELGLRELLALSTQAFTYFQSKGGFVEGTPDDLPPARREKYEQSGRNSKVLVKKLNERQGPHGRC